jgi:hypothetical protein
MWAPHNLQVLASDMSAVYDCMFANEDILDKLFSFLDKEAPLKPLVAGYFGNIVATLIVRRPDETFKYMETKDIMSRFLKHLNTYSIIELLLKVILRAIHAAMSSLPLCFFFT